MLLHFENGDSFATGATIYEYRPVTERETTPRIVISVKIGDVTTLAFVDTGGVYAICSPEIANDLNLDPMGGEPADPISWRGMSLRGLLYRIPLTIIAEEGASLQIEPTFFVPELQPNQTWDEDFPCVLGMYLCLERLRFAVDPASENPTFYFGESG